MSSQVKCIYLKSLYALYALWLQACPSSVCRPRSHRLGQAACGHEEPFQIGLARARQPVLAGFVYVASRPTGPRKQEQRHRVSAARRHRSNRSIDSATTVAFLSDDQVDHGYRAES
jgi:hypothetical protein